jgi:hypothetical protein
VVAFPIGMAPPAAAQTAEAPASADTSASVLVHPDTPSAPSASEPPLPAAAPHPAVEGRTL